MNTDPTDEENMTSLDTKNKREPSYSRISQAVKNNSK
jgi:hypothetical protein